MKRKLFSLMLVLLVLLLSAALLVRRTGEEMERAVFAELSYPSRSELLASAIACLSEEEDGYAVKLAIGGVLLARLQSPLWGQSLWEVCFPASEDGVVWKDAEPSEVDYSAARDALAGFSPARDALRFQKATSDQAPQGAIVIGEYWFFE